MKKILFEVILKKIGVIGDGDHTYYKVTKICVDIIADILEYAKRLCFKIRDTIKTLTSMYWILKMHTNMIGACFILASIFC